ncbi:MAG: glycosyltransferase [Candidatus Pacebacteria bacterium]|nr:glycosyltransferase [Candidatus Paceibacterota bacterium]
MRLLIVTQAVDRNHPVLGFFHRWIQEFAAHCEQVEVITLFEGKHTLPKNVQVHSLGKEKEERSSFSYALRFLRLVWKLRNEYDVVFVHMNVEYLLVAGWLWKTFRKRVALWYTHGTVSWRLRLAAVFADILFTASEASMRLRTSKKRVVGHGMDLRVTLMLPPPSGSLHLMTAGRVAPVKRLERMIEAVAALRKEGSEVTFSILGGPVTPEDKVYEARLRLQVAELGLSEDIRLLGPQDLAGVRSELSHSHLFLHASETGSLDKAPLEALAAGVPVVSTNPEIGGMVCAAYLADSKADGFLDALKQAISERAWEDPQVRTGARTYVETTHELSRLIPRILADLAQVS